MQHAQHAQQAQHDRGRNGTGAAGPPPAPPPRNHNRLYVLLAHTSRYAFEPQARLARDVGVSRSTISRLMNGKSRPSFELVRRVTAALEKALNRPLDPREIFSPSGGTSYPTRSGCQLCGCRGCMPEEAYDRWGRLRPGFRNQRPGDWTLSPAAEPTEAAPS